MYKLKIAFKKLFTPVSIMLIPHDSKRPINIKVPTIGVFVSVLFWLTGSIYVCSIAIDTFEYYRMKNTLNYYAAQFTEIRSTVQMVQRAEGELRGLLSGGSKKEILEKIDPNTLSETEALDMEALKAQLGKTVESVASVKEYLTEQRDRYAATPSGWPATGSVTSHFGKRADPMTGEQSFHEGIDISVPKGTPVKVTADGVVSFSGWHAGSGNLVVVEHGFGFTTCYAHNKSSAVTVGQRVKRGEIVAHSGSTGYSTGPHVHYEVWRNGKAVSPKPYLEGANYVSKEK